MKILCTDIDETLIDNELRIPDVNREKIKAFLEEGNKVILATGRPFSMVPQYIHPLELEKYGSYFICLNGAASYDSSFQAINIYPLDQTYLREVINLGIERNHCVQLHTEKENYAFNVSPEETERYRLIGDTFVTLREDEIKNLEKVTSDTVLKMLFQDEDFSRLEETYRLHKDLLDHYNITFSSHRYLEINTKGVSKGDSLRELFSINGWDLKKLVTVGDSLNDYSMMLEQSFNVAVKNAVPKILENADYVTQRDNTQGAVAEVLDRIDEFLASNNK